MARSGQIQLLLGEEFAIHHIPPNGDCFYEAVAHALSTDEVEVEAASPPTPSATCVHTPAALRSIVATSLTEETMELFRMTHEAGIGGFEFMRKVADLDALKQRHRISGRDTSPGNCIWANDFGIQTVATHLRVCLHIMDEESGRARSSRGGRERSADGSSDGSGKRRKTGTFVTIRPETPRDVDADGHQGDGWRHILLQRTRRQHYNLIVQRLDDEEGDGGNVQKKKQKKGSGKGAAVSSGTKSRLKEKAIFRTLPPLIQELWGFE